MTEPTRLRRLPEPIDARTVNARTRNEYHKAVVVHGSRLDFPAADPLHPGRFHPTANQVAAVLAGSGLDFDSRPIGERIAREIAAIHELAQHAASEGEGIESVCV